MSREMYQGGSSRKQAPRLAIHGLDLEPPREAQVRPCEWPLDEFMVHAGFKEEFDAYIQTLTVRTSLHISPGNTISLLIPLWGGLNLHPSVTRILFC